MPVNHFDFESDTKRGSFIKICDDMMESAAWVALNRSQRSLYAEMKRKFTAVWGGSARNRKLLSDNRRDISFTQKDIKELYSDSRIFRADIDKLISCGFIDCISSGKSTKQCNIYGFTGRWKRYGRIEEKDGKKIVVVNPDYSVPPEFIRPVLTESEKQARVSAKEKRRRQVQVERNKRRTTAQTRTAKDTAGIYI